MSVRKISLALVVSALGLVLVGGALIGSNMGFKLERNFRYIDGNQNLYYLSLPFFSEYADCDELLIDFVGQPTDNDFNSMTLELTDIAANDIKTRTCRPHPVGPPDFDAWLITGDDPWTIDSSIGYKLVVLDNAGPSGDDNNVVIVGSHDPEYAGYDINFQADMKNLYPVSVPYHTTWVTVEDLLIDTFVNGPDTSDVAEATAFSFANYDYETQASINEFFTVSIRAHPVGPPDFDAYLITGDTDPGANPTFNVTPGDGYVLNITNDAATPFQVTYLSPHF